MEKANISMFYHWYFWQYAATKDDFESYDYWAIYHDFVQSNLYY